MSVPQKSYDEIVDLFARTSSAEVLAFRPSADSQERAYVTCWSETRVANCLKMKRPNWNALAISNI
jgi:hypothetical protein